MQGNPRTMDELVAQYDQFITGCIYKVSRGHVRPDDLDDLRQQILTRVHERDYLAKYDPAKGGSFKTYLYWLIRSVVVNQFESNTRNPLNMAVGVTEYRSEETRTRGTRREFSDTKRLVLETFSDARDDDFERRMLARDLADRFERHLAQTARPWGPEIRLPDGTRTRRSLALVFRLLRNMLEPTEIARVMGVAPPSVFGYLKRIRVEARSFAAV